MLLLVNVLCKTLSLWPDSWVADYICHTLSQNIFSYVEYLNMWISGRMNMDETVFYVLLFEGTIFLMVLLA